MINVSNEFKKLMNKRTDFKQNAEITFADGTVLELTEKDFTIQNNNIVDGSDVNGIPLGIAVCRSVQIELMNDDDRFSSYDFFGAEIRLYLTFELSSTIEKVECGKFTVYTPETYGETIIISALDDMHKADKEYTTNLVFPASLQSMLIDACNTIDIPLFSINFANSDFVVNSMPEGITFRQLFGYIAMIAGGNARVRLDGWLEIISYDASALEELYIYIDGGTFNPWQSNYDLDGGTFNPWNDGNNADGGTFTDGERYNYHILYNWKNIKIDTDDVVITGIGTTIENEEGNASTLLSGIDGYVLNLDNPLIIGKEQSVVDYIGSMLIGMKFRQFSGDLVANPTIEFMDYCIIADRKGNLYPSFITDVNFNFFGFTVIKNSAETALRNSSKYYSDATKTMVNARKLVIKEKTNRELAIEKLANNLANSSGLYMTQEEQPDGSNIYYMHDKATLSESMIIWKLTSLAFAISTDGGKTYPYGFTVDGTAITRLLYAEGIDADYITTGALKISGDNGNILFLADFNTGNVHIDADNVLVEGKSIALSVSEQITETKSYADSITENLGNSLNNSLNEQISETKNYANTVASEAETSAATNSNSYTDNKLKNYSTTKEMDSAIELATNSIRLEVTARTSLYNEEINTLQGGMEDNLNLSFFYTEDGAIITTQADKNCIYAGTGEDEVQNKCMLYQDVNLPSGTYSFTYEWLRTLSVYTITYVKLINKTTGEELYSKNLGYAWPALDTWTKETFQFGLAQTSSIRFLFEFEAPSADYTRINSTYLTNIAIYGTAQSVADAITDVKTQLLLQEDEIIAKVDKNGVIGSINVSSEEVVIKASKIDLQGLVEADEFITTFATITTLNSTTANLETLIAKKASISDLNASNARISTIESSYVSANEIKANYATITNLNAVSGRVSNIEANYITANTVSSNYATISSLNASNARILSIESNYIAASTVKANYMEVANWTSAGKIKAERIDVDNIVSRISASNNITVGGLNAQSVVTTSINVSTGASILGRSVSWKTATINGVTIRYLGY